MKADKILVHSLFNLGDVLLSTSAVALLRQAFPQAHITMMVRPESVDMLTDHPDINELIVFDYRGRQRSLAGQLKILQEIKKRKFDVVISFDRKPRLAILSWLAQIPVRVVPDRIFDDVPTWATRLYTHVIHIPYQLPEHHQADSFQEIVRQFCGITGTARPVMGRILPEHEHRAAELLGRLPQKEKKIALCIKGTFALKNWPRDRFAALVDKLDKQLDAAFYVIGTAGDKAYAEEMIRMASVPIANFCGETGVRDLAALMERTDLFITVDTGATHVAATTRVPMVVVYGCSRPRRSGPCTDHAITISKEPPCCPCKIAEDDCDAGQCLLKISVEEMADAALEAIKLRLL